MPSSKYPRKYSKKGTVTRKPWRSGRQSKYTAVSKFKAIRSYGVPEAPFPAKLVTCCTYANTKQLTNALAGVAQANAYRLNSIYDPDFTGLGRTVVGWDSLNALYSRYLVVRAKIYVNFFNPSSNVIRAGIRLRMNGQNPAAGNSIQDILEKPMTFYKVLNPTANLNGKFVLDVYPWQLIGISKEEYMKDPTIFGAAMNDNPSTSCFADVFSVDDNDNGACNYDIKIVYETIFFRRVGQVSSVLV